MNRILRICCMVLLGLMVLMAMPRGPLWAAPGVRYVIDQFKITLRRGDGPSFKIVKQLLSGTRLVVIRNNGAGWVRVRTEEGDTGWVLQRYLVEEVPARVRLEGALEARERAETRLAKLKKEHAVINGRLVSQKKLEKELAHVRHISKNALNLKRENDRFKRRLQELSGQLYEIRKEKTRLEKNVEQRFFLIGAGVLFFGGILGVLFAGRRRRSSYL
ncbi:MAG: TIGR04211 family SH3 domain-containing protein [Magnetococcales bacterium]|nr:TIGR04211 family SH3 domain-containing protein [Magnetococcales bacterium]